MALLILGLQSLGGLCRWMRWCGRARGLAFVYAVANLHSAASTIRSRCDSQVATQADTGVREGIKCLLAVDDADTVINVDTNGKASADGVNLNSGWRAP